MIEIHELSKTYRDRKRGDVEALRGVSFTCRPGEVFGLLGPNGAGKTTALRVISTALRPTRGGGTVMGYDLVRQPAKVRENIGFLSSNT
ncbi:MAG: ATP-binding cassette domain-containing protein, partial [Phycisphaerales bacterium]